MLFQPKLKVCTFVHVQASCLNTRNRCVLVVWNIIYFPIYFECHHPNWLLYFSEDLKPPIDVCCLQTLFWGFVSFPPISKRQRKFGRSLGTASRQCLWTMAAEISRGSPWESTGGHLTRCWLIGPLGNMGVVETFLLMLVHASTNLHQSYICFCWSDR